MNIHKTRVGNSVEISTDYLWNMTLVSTVILWISHTNILDITIHSSDKSTEADCILHNMPTIYLASIIPYTYVHSSNVTCTYPTDRCIKQAKKKRKKGKYKEISNCDQIHQKIISETT